MSKSLGLSRTVGVFVDVASVSRNGGYGMRYDILRAFACRDGSEPIRLNAYVAYDHERATTDALYRATQENYYSLLRDFGYKVIQKTLRWYVDENGNRFGRANTDLDMAVDVLLQSEHMDRVVIVTGDGDFARIVQALQSRGCRVEVVAFENVAQALRREADAFFPGYFIPNLLPTMNDREGAPWGEAGSRVRGVCYSHYDKGYGFFRFLQRIGPDLWKIDSRQEDSPYATAFFHDSNLPPDVNPTDLPSRNLIFEFELTLDETKNRGFVARNISLVSPRRRSTPSRSPSGQETEVLSPMPASLPPAQPHDESQPGLGDWKPGQT